MKVALIFLLAAFFVLVPRNTLCAEHLLRVGTYTVSSNQKLILLGIESRPEIPSADLDFESLGFQGNGLNHVDPRFLLEVGPSGVEKVRAFEMGALTQEEIEESHRTPQLPRTLLDVNRAKWEKKKHAIGNSLAFIGKSLGPGIATATALATLPRKHSEIPRKLQAYYLMELINKTLPPFNGFPEFKEALSSYPAEAEVLLRRLGEALLTRFHPKSNWSGLHIPEHKFGEFYENWRSFQAGNRSMNTGSLIDRANEEELEVILMGNDFAFVLLDNQTAVTKFSNAPSLVRSNPPQADQTQRFIPWYLVSFLHPKGPVDLVNFSFPGKYGQTLQRLTRRSVALEVGGSLIPMPFSNLLVKGFQKGIEDRALKHHDTEYLNRLESYGAVLALAETQFHKPPTVPGVSYSPFRQALGTRSLVSGLDRYSQASLLNDVTALLAAQEEAESRLFESATASEKRVAKAFYYHQLRKVISPTSSRSSRSPCSLGKPKPALPERNPVIVFMIDGLRPDRFLNAAREGLLPHLKSLFVDRGINLESFTSRALTLPSWSTILTGFEGDVHGVRSNTPISKVARKITDNFLDPWADIFVPKNRYKNRAFRRLEEDKTGEEGKIWLPAYFDKHQVHLNYMPISFRPNIPARDLISDYFSHRSSYANDSRFLASALDVASAKNTARAIQGDSKGTLRLVMNWYGSVDEASHHNNQLLPHVYQELDKGIGEVMQAAKNHPVLRNATVVLISDHGHSGGFGPFDLNSTIFRSSSSSFGVTEGPLLANTAFNLTKFFAGEIRGMENYGFKVGAYESNRKPFDLGLMEEFQMPSFKYTHPQRHAHATALVDYAGDNIAQVYLISDTEPDARPSFYNLSHFRGHPSETPLDIPADLLRVKTPNIRVTDEGLKSRILELSGQRPIRLFAMPLAGQTARSTADLLGAPLPVGPSDRDPILVIANKRDSDQLRTALILTKNGVQGNDLFRYVVIKNFSQTPSGEVRGEVSLDPQDDPLDYLPTVLSDAASATRWRTDREWLELAKDHPMPTVVFSLARTLTLSPRYLSPGEFGFQASSLSESVKAKRKAEVPDFVLLSHPGYAFRYGDSMESDHGGLLREEVRNSFFISSLNERTYRVHQDAKTPVLSRDVMPTVLNFAGLGEPGADPIPVTQGISLKEMIHRLANN